MRELTPYEFKYQGDRYTVAFQEIQKGIVLFHVTGHYLKGRMPRTVDAGKVHSKKEALQRIKQNYASYK